MQKKSAFTLAEMLITLAIIGVVAALTIPTVVQNYQKKQTVVLLKKAFSAINQAISLSQVENGHPTTWDMTRWRDVTFYERYFKKYLKINKYLGVGITFGDTKGLDGIKIPYRWLDGNIQTGGYISGTNSGAKVVLADGQLVVIEPKNTETLVFVDVNGYKAAPNIYGKDTFLFVLYKSNGKFMPEGYALSIENMKNSNSGACNKNSRGLYCAALIMKNGWEIKDDYPW